MEGAPTARGETRERFPSGNPGISSHRGPGTVPVEQPQQAVPPGLSGGSSGGGLGAPPGYAQFVTSAVGSAMEPFLQNMAQVVGEQTAQITVVNQRVEQLASVVSQTGLSSVSGFGERPPVSPVRNFGVPVMTAEGVPVHFEKSGNGIAGNHFSLLVKMSFSRSSAREAATPGPQEHNVIGSAERGVREVKEAIAVVRLELAKHQLDIVDSLVGWDGICRYVVAMHNLHGKKFGKTPRELLRDSPASRENPDEPGEPVRLVPKAEVKADPKDPSSSESSSDDGEGEEEEREEDPDGEGSEQSELFESSVAPIAAGKSAPALKGKPALVEAKGQKVPVQLPSKPSSGRPKAMPSTLKDFSLDLGVVSDPGVLLLL
eukprot:symbB.v1.2.036605.t1/scaffold5121.1/size30665/3